MDGYLELGVFAFGFFPCVFNGFTGGKYDSVAAVSLDLGFTEKTDLYHGIVKFSVIFPRVKLGIFNILA